MKDQRSVERIWNIVAAMPPEQLTVRMGMTLKEVSHGRLVGTLPVTGNRGLFRLLHGGASCALAETLGTLAGLMHAGPDRASVGVELLATHHRGVREGLLTGVCTPLFEGRSLATYEIVLTDSAERRICTARRTCMLRGRESGEPAGPSE
jgi:uncharacterized protein (TIGR00369 family)